jgi:flavin-dependent dehydrogenase
VIGGGPAGATAGRLLAEWGHRVVILDRPPAPRSLAESLPPSARKILEHVGILERVERARFWPATGTTSWWGDPRGRSEHFPGASGFQVLRSDFDRVLLSAARDAGAGVHRGVTVRRVELVRDRVAVEYLTTAGAAKRVFARFVLDCTGRAGVIARRFRVRDRRLTTVAISGVWRRAGGFADIDPGHTLVEAYADGWAWSVPLSNEERHVAVMVDPVPRRRAPGGAPARYRSELARTARFSGLLAGATLADVPWTCDASVYAARAYGGERFLLVGDAGSFLDPMSSFGVKKALASAWMSAVVANTCLRRPERAAAALDLFSRREREMAATYERESARYLREARERHPSRFWRRRAGAAPKEGEEDQLPAVRAAFERLKRMRRLRLSPGARVRPAQAPEIQGTEIVLAEAVASPALPDPVRHVRGVLVPALLRVVSSHADVPALHAAYNRIGPPVGTADFLAALSFLLAKGVLEAR